MRDALGPIADFAECLRLLIDVRVKSSVQQRRRRREAADAAANDCDRGPTGDGHTACLRLLDQTSAARVTPGPQRIRESEPIIVLPLPSVGP